MKLLFIGAHSDDIELNCLGTILKAKKQGDECYLVICTNGANGGNPQERTDEQDVVNKKVGYKKTWSMGLPDGSLEHKSNLVSVIDQIVREVQPDIVFTHTENDFHQDHIAVAKSVKSSNRGTMFSLITFPSQDIKIPFHANLFVDISDYFEKKLEIVKEFKSQLNKAWLQKDTIMARNIGTGVAKYVEKFHIEFLKI